uniref:Cytochrome c domain-containing protein n=1 Tax=Solibacter usitatus (strain Ellin6076) TaxID=234267 RepID=Q022G0_SOLUE
MRYERVLLTVGLAAVAGIAQDFSNINAGGFSSSVTAGRSVDLTGPYFQAQGSNGRSCSTCHLQQEAWSITPETIRLLFVQTAGTHPIFNPLDADNPEGDLSSAQARSMGYSMMLTRGVFRRGGAPAAVREWDVIAVDDPHGYANVNRIVQWRRVMPTINFRLGSATVAWDGGNTTGADQVAGLTNQAMRNVTGAQQGHAAPADVIGAIVGFETSLSAAQQFSFSAGSLNAGGARGGPEELPGMLKAPGRFDLFDAWMKSPSEARARIARGQQLFNNPNAGNGRSCNFCHSSSNNGTNFSDALFDIGTASAEARTPDLPLYTIRNRTTGEERRLTDTGQGNVTGLWSDLGKFKTPTLRALSARAPYFHNGIAATLDDVVRHYERRLNFVFTDQEREDLVAFLRAL